VDTALPIIINQSYTNSLVKYGNESTIGNLKIKALNSNIVLKDMYFTLSDLSANDMNKISSAQLYEDGVEIASLIKTGNQFYATNINNTITVDITKTYELKANFVSITTSGDALPIFKTVLSNSVFENHNN
jgi:hypothetical protein